MNRKGRDVMSMFLQLSPEPTRQLVDNHRPRATRRQATSVRAESQHFGDPTLAHNEQRLSGPGLPQAQRVVVAARRHQLAVGAESEAGEIAGMAQEAEDCLALLHVPELGDAVLRG